MYTTIPLSTFNFASPFICQSESEVCLHLYTPAFIFRYLGQMSIISWLCHLGVQLFSKWLMSYLAQLAFPQ